MNMPCTARLKFDARRVAKNAIYTAFICNFCFRFMHTFLSQKLFMYLFVTKEFAHTFFVAKTIYAPCPESFCALKVAIRKVQTFWASDADIEDFVPILCRFLHKKVVNNSSDFFCVPYLKKKVFFQYGAFCILLFFSKTSLICIVCTMFCILF